MKEFSQDHTAQEGEGRISMVMVLQHKPHLQPHHSALCWMKDPVTWLSMGPSGKGRSSGELQRLGSVHDGYGSVTPANCGNADLLLPNLPIFKENPEIQIFMGNPLVFKGWQQLPMEKTIRAQLNCLRAEPDPWPDSLQPQGWQDGDLEEQNPGCTLGARRPQALWEEPLG